MLVLGLAAVALLVFLVMLEGNRGGGRAGLPTALDAGVPGTERGDRSLARGVQLEPSSSVGRASAPSGADLGSERASGSSRTRAAAPPGAPGAADLARVQPPPEPFVWVGRVTAPDALEGVANAELELSGGPRTRRAVTDGEGRFRFDWFAGVESNLTVRHAGYVDVRDPTVELEQPGAYVLIPSATLVVELVGAAAPRGSDAPGASRVPEAERAGEATVDATGSDAGAEPVAVEVHLWHQRDPRAWKWPERVVVASGGHARFEDLEPGEYALWADAPGAVSTLELGLALAPGEERLHPVELDVPATASGEVVLRGTGEPVASARIEVEPRVSGGPQALRRLQRVEAETDAQGRFALEGLGPGRHRVRIELPWHARVTRDLDVASSGEQVETRFEVPPPVSLNGHVVDAKGRAASGARVLALPSYDRGQLAKWTAWLEAPKSVAGEATEPAGGNWVTADARGAFHFEALGSGQPLFVLAVARTGGAPGQCAVPRLDPEDPAPADVLVQLPPDLALAGRVRSPSGEHLAGVGVELFAHVEDKRVAWRRTTTGEDGRYLLEGLPEGRVAVEFRKTDYLDALEFLELGAAPREELDVELVPALILRGVALDPDGLAVSGVRVRVRPDPDSVERFADVPGLAGRELADLRYATRTNGAGEFLVGNLLPVDWIAELDSHDWELQRSEPRVLGPGDEETWTLHLAPGGRATRAILRAFLVRAADGGPPVGVEVKGLRGSTFEADGGELRVTGIAPGPVRPEFRAQGCVPVRLPTFELAPGEDRDLGRIELAPGTRLTVRVEDAAGEPIEGARVRLRSLPKAAGGIGQGVPVVNPVDLGGGRYRWEAAPRGAFRLVVARSGYRSVNRPQKVLPQEQQGRTIQLDPKP